MCSDAEIDVAQPSNGVCRNLRVDRYASDSERLPEEHFGIGVGDPDQRIRGALKGRAASAPRVT